MKKTLLFAVAVAMTVGFTSCKKDWICDCGGNDTFDIKQTTKRIAKTQCEGSTPLTGNITGCTLK